MTFDSKAIAKEGHDDTVIVVVTNSNDFMDVIETKNERISSLEELLTVIL